MSRGQLPLRWVGCARRRSRPNPQGTATCPQDCGSTCGDGACNGSDTTANCPADCGPRWLNRQTITFDNTASAENLVDFPVLVTLDASNIDFAKIKAGGADIRFVDDDGTALEVYDTAARDPQ